MNGKITITTESLNLTLTHKEAQELLIKLKEAIEPTHANPYPWHMPYAK